jgi:hypothetical protein
MDSNNTFRSIALYALAGLVALGVVFFLVTTFQGISYRNQATELEVAAQNQIDVTKTAHDTMKKIVFGQAGVADAYADRFERVYKSMMDSRYQTGGEMMKFVAESNPQLSPELYTRVQQSIEEQQLLFQAAQKQLISYRNEHDKLCKTWPGSFYLAGRARIEIPVVTSAATERVFQTGQDNDDPNPFARKKE